MAPPKKMQLLSGEGEFFRSQAERFAENMTSPHMVISIIGAQSSGKSCLLNALFKTNFEELIASTGRNQTTKGIWISEYTDPCMIIMDVEGSDGDERKDDKSFERQSALFSLATSHVLLLNMNFLDIGRNEGASRGLLKILFQEILLISEQKTRVIVVIRDYVYQSPLDVITQKLQTWMKELWKEVTKNPNIKMDDYIEVTVQDLPHKLYLEDKFKDKCNELRDLLCSYAKKGNYASALAYILSSERTWNLIRANGRLNAADHKEAMSIYVCSQIMEKMMNSLHKEKDYQSLIEGKPTSVEDFNKLMGSFLKSFLSRYESDTASLTRSVRDEKRRSMEIEILKKLERTFESKLTSLGDETITTALSEACNELKVFRNPKDSVNQVVKVYIDKFNRGCGDVHQHFECLVVRYRGGLQSRLKTIIQKVANEHKETQQAETHNAGWVRQITDLTKGLAVGVGLGIQALVEHHEASLERKKASSSRFEGVESNRRRLEVANNRNDRTSSSRDLQPYQRRVIGYDDDDEDDEDEGYDDEPSLFKKLGPYGGSGGEIKDMGQPTGVTNIAMIQIQHGDYIDALQVYYNCDGTWQSTGRWGGGGGEAAQQIKFKAGEYITDLIGHTDHIAVTSLQITTNHNNVYGPFGTPRGTRFLFQARGSEQIIGFHGRSGDVLDAIGVYVKYYI